MKAHVRRLLVAASLMCAIGAAARPALAAPLISLTGSSGGAGVSIGETEVGVHLPHVEGAPSLPEAQATVGGEESAVGVSVGGQPVVEVPNPTGSTPAPSPPPLSQPPTKAPSTSSPTPSSPAKAAGGSQQAAAPVAIGGSRGQHASSPARRIRASGHELHTGGIAPAAVPAAAATPTPLALTAHVTPARRTSASAGSDNPLDALGRSLSLPLPVPDWSKPIILALLLVALAFAVRSQLAARRARRLEAQREALQHDVNVMQATLVPEVPAQLGGLSFSVAYRPADGPAAGGDFYDVFAPAPGKVAVVLGDVAGHGFRAVKHAALTRYTLRAYLQAGLEPRAALALAGKALADHDEEVLATVAVGTYDSEEATFTYALAGHPPPLMRGFQARESVSICCSPPLGWSVPTGRRQRTLTLPRGAQMCFFSDGLIEARCAVSGADMLLGRERLRSLLDAQLGPEPSAPALLASVGAAALATPDDMAACILTSAAPTGTELRDVEELELDAVAIAGGTVRDLLAAWGVADGEIEERLREAGAVAAEHETAVLRVEHAPRAGRVTVVRPVAGEPAPVPAAPTLVE